MFGEISTGKMMLNDAGKMVENWYHELENKFSDIKCHEYVVMSNHFQCIIENVSRPISDQRPLYGRDNKKYNATIGDIVDWFMKIVIDQKQTNLKFSTLQEVYWLIAPP